MTKVIDITPRQEVDNGKIDESSELFKSLEVVVDSIIKNDYLKWAVTIFAGGRRYGMSVYQLLSHIEFYGSIEVALDRLIGQGVVLESYRKRGQVGVILIHDSGVRNQDGFPFMIVEGAVVFKKRGLQVIPEHELERLYSKVFARSFYKPFKLG